MKIAIHQPNYLPYPGFFAKLNLSDIFVLYDTAQFTKGDFHNRNRIRTFFPNKYVWLTLPTGKRNFEGIAINEIEIANGMIFEDHSKTIRQMYSNAPFFDKEVCECVAAPHENLAEHNTFIIRFLIDKLRIKQPRIVLSSELGVTIRHGTEGLIDIVRTLDADEYVSGTGAKSYLKEDLFEENSIKLSYLNYKPLEYHQIHPGFVENMSVIDAIFNIGWKETAAKISCER